MKKVLIIFALFATMAFAAGYLSSLGERVFAAQAEPLPCSPVVSMVFVVPTDTTAPAEQRSGPTPAEESLRRAQADPGYRFLAAYYDAINSAWCEDDVHQCSARKLTAVLKLQNLRHTVAAQESRNEMSRDQANAWRGEINKLTKIYEWANVQIILGH